MLSSILDHPDSALGVGLVRQQMVPPESWGGRKSRSKCSSANRYQHLLKTFLASFLRSAMVYPTTSDSAACRSKNPPRQLPHPHERHMISSSGRSFTLRFRGFGEVGAMWQQLSPSEKFWVVCCGLGAAVILTAALLIRSLSLASVGVGLGCLASSLVERSRRRGSGEPQPRAISSGTPEFETGTAAFTGGVARLPLAAWLYFGGFAANLIASFLPYWTGNTDRKAQSFARSGNFMVTELVVTVVMYGVIAVLVWATFTRSPARRGTLIALTVWIGIMVLNVISDWTFGRPSSGSPAAGLFLDMASTSFLAVRVVMDWIARSKVKRIPSHSISERG
jgi:hypothetical protein